MICFPVFADPDDELISSVEKACDKLETQVKVAAFDSISEHIRFAVGIRKMVWARLEDLRSEELPENHGKIEILDVALQRLDDTIWEAIKGIGFDYLYEQQEDNEDYRVSYWDIFALRVILKECVNSYDAESSRARFATYYRVILKRSFQAKKTRLMRRDDLSFRPDERETLDILAATYERMLHASRGREDYSRDQVMAEARTQGHLPYEERKTRETLIKSDQLRPDWHGRYGSHRESIGGETVHLDQGDFADMVARRDNNPIGESDLSVLQARDAIEAVRLPFDVAFRSLDYRPREILKARFFEGMTLKEVGMVFRISPERVRQIERKALQELRMWTMLRYEE